MHRPGPRLILSINALAGARKASEKLWLFARRAGLIASA